MANKALPTLYKRNARGGITQWRIVVEGSTYYSAYGELGGREVHSARIEAQPKNVGRSNETTAYEQAWLEAKSEWEIKKKSDNYVENIKDVDKLAYEKPMLARVYNRIWTPQLKFIQPKLDGIRCNISCYHEELESLSRKNNLFYSIPHIENELRAVLEKHPTIHLDGELYNHALHDDFNKIVSLVKKQNVTDKDLAETKRLVRYNVYDLWDDSRPDMSFDERYELAQELLSGMKHVELVTTRGVASADDIDVLYSKFMAEGYEGAIVRTNDPYQHKRCNNLLKYKEFMEGEFEVVSIREGRAGGKAEFAHVLLPNGKMCKATLAFTDEVCVAILANKYSYVGKKASVRFFGYTPDGMLRFPVLKAFRDYE